MDREKYSNWSVININGGDRSGLTEVIGEDIVNLACVAIKLMGDQGIN